MLFGIIETLLRVCLFPIGVILVFIASIFGFKIWIRESWFLKYCCPWRLEANYWPLANLMCNWFDPDYE